MSKFKKELDQFVKEYYKQHDVNKATIQGWLNQAEKSLAKLEKESKGFEGAIESRLEKMGKRLEKEKKHVEKMFE